MNVSWFCDIGCICFECLLYIGKFSVLLCIDVFKVVIKEVKGGKDVCRYKEVWDVIWIVVLNDFDVVWDEEWIDWIMRVNKIEIVCFEIELKGYKNNLIKESIRVRFFVIFCWSMIFNVG